MIEQALYNHLISQESLLPYLAAYNDRPAIFNQEAPADTDCLWGCGSQYGRIVFSVDIQGDPARTMGGVLAVDIMCKENEQFPEEIEPIVRRLIHGYFFSSDTFAVAAQWKNTSFFTEPTNEVTGCTATFDLLGFPRLTTFEPDVIARLNKWTSERFSDIHVINYDELPSDAWIPDGNVSAVYWRCLPEKPAKWIPDTFHTIWRTTTVKGHIFSQNIATAEKVARKIIYKLYTEKRLFCDGESPIMVNRNNDVDMGSDPLRTGQISIEATFGVIVHYAPDQMIQQIGMSDNTNERRTVNGSQIR